MAEIIISVITPNETEKVTMRVPDNIAVGQLIDAVVENMALPVRGNDGRALRYRLNVRTADGTLERLNNNETLQGNDVTDGDVLQLTIEMTGEGPYERNVDPQYLLQLLTDQVENLTNEFRAEINDLYIQFATQRELLQEKLNNQQALFRPLVNQVDELTHLFALERADLHNKLNIFQKIIIKLEDSITELLKNENSAIPPVKPIKPPLDEYSPIDFLDFDLTLSKNSNGYQVSGNWSNGIQNFTAEYLFGAMPVSQEELIESYLKPMGFIIRSGSQDRGEIAEKLGKLMFDGILAGSVRETFRLCQDYVRQNNRHLRMRFNLKDTPELVNYPWEFLWSEEDEFLGCHHQVSIVRYLPMTRPTPAREIELPLKMLVVTANRTGFMPLNVNLEKQIISDALKNLVDNNIVQLEWLENATIPLLNRQLETQKWHILHYIGHGGVDKNGGYLILEGETNRSDFLYAQSFTTMIQACPQLQLVTLNTCHGAQSNDVNPFASIAMRLVRNRVPAVVAMQQEIHDKIAVYFSHEFYKCLAAGCSVYAAMRQTRRKLLIEKHAPIEWAIPVLYSHSPDGVIFRINRSTES